MAAPIPALNVALDRLEDQYGLTPPPEAIAEAFSEWIESDGKQMYPHQEEALLAIVSGDHLIAATPTGSGKSMIGVQALFTALATGRTGYYTAPLKALVSEKFFDLIGLFGAHNVGMVTGDSAINADAPIICATAEILANLALREGSEADVGIAVMDEFHFYADPQRGWAWQVPLLELTKTQHVLLSATLGDTTFFEKDLKRRSGREVSVVSSAVRPVPLHFTWNLDPINETIQDLVSTHMAPVYVVYPSQREAVAGGQALLGMSLISKERKEEIAKALGRFKFGTGFGATLSKLLRQGIGVHHAGLLPRYRRLVERLTQAGLLSVICGTDTLGVGINVPIRTVLIASLAKFDGTKMRHLTAREFHQVAGRAGRAGFDTVGYVVVQAPEHEVENARRVRKAGDDPVKLKRVQKVKPEEGKLSWSEKTFEKLRDKAPETLTSHLSMTHAIVLNLMQRPDPVRAIWHLLEDNHEPEARKSTMIRQMLEIVSSLEIAEVLKRRPRELDELTGKSEDQGPRIFFTKDVPSDFALNAPLSPFALSAFDLLDPESETFGLDLLSIVEAVQEDPTQVLIAQRKQAKGELINKLKAQGVDYNERMALADEASWPQPLAELLQPALETYAQSNPWVKDHELSPKSIVREMIETASTFSEFISRYDLQRSEGILLRYLTDTYRALRQIVPTNLRTEEIDAIIDWLGKLVRSIDSSLLDEWEALADGTVTLEELDLLSGIGDGDESVSGSEAAFGADENGHVAFSRNKYAVRTAIRNAMFEIVELLERDDLEELESRYGRDGWNLDRWDEAAETYWDQYEYLGVDGVARGSEYFQILEDPSLADLLQAGASEELAEAWLEGHKAGRLWLTIQVIVDHDDPAEADGAWAIWAVADLDASDASDGLVLHMLNFAQR